jgi:hypothetical protein
MNTEHDLLRRRARHDQLEGGEPFDENNGLRKEEEDDMWFRGRTHRLWRQRSNGVPNDCGAAGLKLAMLEWSNAWYVSTSLSMTVAFAFLVFKPTARPTWDHQLALYAYLIFTVRAIYLSLSTIISCGFWVQNSAAIPAADYSLFISACTQKDPAKRTNDPGDSILLLFGSLMMAATSLAYIEYGPLGCMIAFLGFLRFVQISGLYAHAWAETLKCYEQKTGAHAETYVTPWGDFGAPTISGFLQSLSASSTGEYWLGELIRAHLSPKDSRHGFDKLREREREEGV